MGIHLIEIQDYPFLMSYNFHRTYEKWINERKTWPGRTFTSCDKLFTTHVCAWMHPQISTKMNSFDFISIYTHESCTARDPFFSKNHFQKNADFKWFWSDYKHSHRNSINPLAKQIFFRIDNVDEIYSFFPAFNLFSKLLFISDACKKRFFYSSFAISQRNSVYFPSWIR